jgi:hypothetical protein
VWPMNYDSIVQLYFIHPFLYAIGLISALLARNASVDTALRPDYSQLDIRVPTEISVFNILDVAATITPPLQSTY